MVSNSSIYIKRVILAFLIKSLSGYEYSKAVRSKDSGEVSSTVKSNQCFLMRVFINEAAKKVARKATIVEVQLESKTFDSVSGNKRDRRHSAGLGNHLMDTFQYPVQHESDSNIMTITFYAYHQSVPHPSYVLTYSILKS